MQWDFERCYRAVDSRDPRFDGCFFTAVQTTGIYCRPSCPARTPKRSNVAFFPTAAAAQRHGFRACRRCRPDAAPGSPQWDVSADIAGRAMRLIGDGVVDRDGVPGLAARLGYTERHLHRVLTTTLGAGPLALARAQRAQTARVLIETTSLGFAQIAFAAGFGSVRQFNDTIHHVYAGPPSALRDTRQASTTGPIELRLAFRAPLYVPSLVDFLARRALAGVEEVSDGRYARALALPYGPATVQLIPHDRWVAATLQLTDVRDLAPAVARCRRLYDLDADPLAVDAVLAADPALAPAVAAEPGVRVPRAVDGFELAVRAIVGQRVSVASARAALQRLVTATHPSGMARAESAHPGTARAESAHPGTARAESAHPGTARAESARADHSRQDPTALRAFPDATVVAELPDSAYGMPAARRETVRTLARAVAAGELALDPGADRDATVAQLMTLPGVGAWTAGYIAMRALGDPDVFLQTDLAVRRGAAALGLPDTPAALAERAQRWRPWRSYAMVRLWRAAA